MESYSPSSVHIQFVTFYLFSQEKHKPTPSLLKYICALNPCAFSHKVQKKSNVLVLNVNILNY